MVLKFLKGRTLRFIRSLSVHYGLHGSLKFVCSDKSYRLPSGDPSFVRREIVGVSESSRKSALDVTGGKMHSDIRSSVVRLNAGNSTFSCTPPPSWDIPCRGLKIPDLQ